MILIRYRTTVQLINHIEKFRPVPRGAVVGFIIFVLCSVSKMSNKKCKIDNGNRTLNGLSKNECVFIVKEPKKKKPLCLVQSIAVQLKDFCLWLAKFKGSKNRTFARLWVAHSPVWVTRYRRVNFRPSIFFFLKYAYTCDLRVIGRWVRQTRRVVSACRGRVLLSSRSGEKPWNPVTTCAPENRGRSPSYSHDASALSAGARIRPRRRPLGGAAARTGRGGCSEKTGIVFATRARTRTHRSPTGQLASAVRVYKLYYYCAPRARVWSAGRSSVRASVRACASPRPTGVASSATFSTDFVSGAIFSPPSVLPSGHRRGAARHPVYAKKRRTTVVSVVFFKSLPVYTTLNLAF